MSEHIDVSQHNGVQRLKINRLEKKNALDSAMYETLTQALSTAEMDTHVKVHYITGTEETFSAGNDIQDFMLNPPSGTESPVYQFLTTLATLNKPLIAAANGPAVGIGTTLLLHCDLVYLGEHTRLKTPFADLGLCPEASSSLLLPNLCGHPRACQLLLLGETIDAHTAVSWGLANQVISSEQLQNHALEIAETLAEKPTEAVLLTKKLLRQTQQEQVLKRIDEEGKLFTQRLHSTEAKAAFISFMQKSN